MNSVLLKIKAFTATMEKKEQLRFSILLLLVFSLPFDIFYSSILFLGFLATTLIDIDREKIKRIPKQVWIFQLVYFLGILGYFYSYHKSAASFLLERQLSIFLLPLAVPVAITIDRAKIKALLASLALSCVIAVSYLFIYNIYNIKMDLKLPLLETLFSGAFFNHQFSKILGIHAGYLSLYISLSIFYLVEVVNTYKSVSVKVLIGLVLFILFSGLFFLASRNTVITTFIIIIFISPLYNSRTKIRYILICTICFLVSFLIVKNVPYLEERFLVQLVSDIKPLEQGNFINYSSAEPRFERWKGGFALIKKSPWIGYGTGDEIEMLKTEYIKRGLFISYIQNFNAHNQYLSYLIKNGILGLLIVLSAFFYYFRLAIRNRSFMYLSYLLLLVIGFYTENILDANKGIFFFALFNTFFGYDALKNKQQHGTKISS